jgi:hypothetical protein
MIASAKRPASNGGPFVFFVDLRSSTLAAACAVSASSG